MFESCLVKQEEIKQFFSSVTTQEAKYQKIIELGKELHPIDACYKTEAYLVKGCQSLMYLHTSYQEGLLLFQAASDALISAGLAQLLIKVYSGETPETVLKCPPHYLNTLGIASSLSPNRANGLYSLHLKMKQEALRFLIAVSS
jgi:cysteine desulfuration protein SufE